MRLIIQMRWLSSCESDKIPFSENNHQTNERESEMKNLESKKLKKKYFTMKYARYIRPQLVSIKVSVAVALL